MEKRHTPDSNIGGCYVYKRDKRTGKLKEVWVKRSKKERKGK